MNRHQLAKEIQQISPGDEYRISRYMLQEALWDSRVEGGPERILEYIIGSSYEFQCYLEYDTDDYIFRRLPTPLDVSTGKRTFVSEDRQAFYDLGDDGYYYPRVKNHA